MNETNDADELCVLSDCESNISGGISYHVNEAQLDEGHEECEKWCLNFFNNERYYVDSIIKPFLILKLQNNDNGNNKNNNIEQQQDLYKTITQQL